MPANRDKAEDLDATVQTGPPTAGHEPPDEPHPGSGQPRPVPVTIAPTRRVNHGKLAVWIAVAVGPWLIIAALAWLYFG